MEVLRDRVIREPSRAIPVVGEYEVVVVGGGPAGILAATAAARHGRSTLLVERYGFLGGAGTAAGLSSFCGLYARVYGEHRQVVHGFADELLERMERLDGLAEPHASFDGRILARAYDTAAYKIAADEMVLASGARILFHALAVGVVMEDPSRLRAVVVESKSGRAAILGRVFVDCSGDADLAAWAGVPCEKGDPREGMLYPTTMFRIHNVDPARAGDPARVARLLEEAARRGHGRLPRRRPMVLPQRHPAEWRANVTQVANPDGSPVDGTDVEQLSHGEIEGRRQVREVFSLLRRFVPGFEDAYIVDIAPQLGIRETRRIVGLYRLTEEDVLGLADFPDAVGVNGWPVEAHVAGDVVLRWPHEPEGRGFHQLPYRMLVPQRVENLLVAGRCASMTHGGQSAARVSGPCFVLGQAAGTAAHLALDRGVACRDVDVARLQRTLEADGAFLGRDA